MEAKYKHHNQKNRMTGHQGKHAPIRKKAEERRIDLPRKIDTRMASTETQPHDPLYQHNEGSTDEDSERKICHSNVLFSI